MTTQGEYRVFEFPAEGVWVTVPAQIQVEISLRPADFTEVMGTQDDFHPLRVIGNLKFSNPADPAQTWFRFDPPVEVRVRYTFGDVFRAMNRGKRLALAYWDGRHWVRFEEEHKFRLEVPDVEGYAYFELPEIGDPAISWGT
jgi:hypothetical protein